LLVFFSRQNIVTSPSLLVLATFVLPTATIVFGSLFVYRHTSRRRKLQAFMTLILSTILTITFFVVTSIVTSRIDHDAQPPASPVAFNLS
jgi:chromate transport protein ChrA